MTPDDWHRLKPLIDQALSLPPEARSRFVDQIRVVDEALARDLDGIIRADSSDPIDGTRTAAAS